MERYSEYKDSGVKWLGEIPSHWEVEPFGRHFSFRKGLPITKANLIDSGEAVISYGQIHAKENLGTTMSESLVRYVSRDYLKSYPQCLLTKDDFVFADTSEDIGGSGNFVYNDFPANIFAGYHTIVAKQSGLYNPRYYAYLFKSECWRNHIRSLVNGVKVYSIGRKQLKSNFLLFPSYKEQDAIVLYLDAATSKIDKAIAMQQKMIDLLNERKQIIIQNAVTKGLDENVEMKDSGVEWIGMIPKHWEIIKIKHLAKLQSGSNLTSNEISDTGSYPVYGGNGLRGFYGSYNCEGSYVLIGRQGALCGNINYAEDKFWATEHAVVCYPKKTYNTLWFGEVLRLMNLGQYSLASAQPGLAVERIKGLYVPNPSIEEQNKIALFLKQNIGKIDLYARHCQRQIALLQERKQIIINEVVTGKVKVS